MVTHLINATEGGDKVSRSSDPLDNKHGTEEWQGEDKGGKNTKRDKNAPSGDPLDKASGTEDW